MPSTGYNNCNELFSYFCAFYAEIHTQFHVYVQILRNDNAKKYVLEQFQSFMLQNSILHQTSCVDTPSQNGVAERKNRYLFETAKDLLLQMQVPKHFWADVVSTACFFINRMPSSILNWNTLYHILFPNKRLFPIEPRLFGCTCFVRDVHPHVSKLNLKSLKCIFVSYSQVQKGYRCYCPNLQKYLVSVDVTFLENTPFSQDPFHTSQRENDDFLVYTFASPAPTLIPAQVKPPITQIYTRRHPSVSSPLPAALTSDPILNDDLPIALRKGNVSVLIQFPPFAFMTVCHHNLVLLLHPWDSISLPNKVSEALAHPGWRSAMIEDMDALSDNAT